MRGTKNKNRSSLTGRRRFFIIAIVLVIAAAVDTRRPPTDQFMTRAAIAAIHVYQATLSKWYERAGVQCRFDPTCSHYGEAVMRQFGAPRGGWLAMKRVLRCGPWTPMGTADPPPIGL